MARPRSRSGRMRVAAVRIARPVTAKPVAAGRDVAERAVDADKVMGDVRGARDWSKPADTLSRSDRLASFRPALHSEIGSAHVGTPVTNAHLVCSGLL